MDFKTYYLNQAGNGLPYFQGSQYQRGYGLGGVFRKIFSWIMPIVREHAMPVAKSFGKEILKSTTDVVQDTIQGKNILDSAKNRFGETVNALKSQLGLQDGEGLYLKPGLGINKKRRRLQNNKKKKKKRILDIFDKS